jgi:hypothetical protein
MTKSGTTSKAARPSAHFSILGGLLDRKHVLDYWLSILRRYHQHPQVLTCLKVTPAVCVAAEDEELAGGERLGYIHEHIAHRLAARGKLTAWLWYSPAPRHLRAEDVRYCDWFDVHTNVAWQCEHSHASLRILMRLGLKLPVPQCQRLLPQCGHLTAGLQ